MKRANFRGRKKSRQERALQRLIARIEKDENVNTEKQAARIRERDRLRYFLFGA